MVFTPLNTLSRIYNGLNIIGYKYPRLTCGMKRGWTRDSSRKLLHISSDGNNNDNNISQKREPPWNIMFFGTDGFALQSLVALHNEQKSQSGLIGKLDVVSVSLKKIIPAVSRYCQKEGLSLQTWPVEVLPGSYDVGIVVSFGHLLPSSLINAFPLGILNVHGSLLPRWRGAAPIIHAVLNNDRETGVTIMKIHPRRFDVGEIVSQATVPIHWNTMSGPLTQELAVLGAQELLLALKRMPKNLELAVPQPTEGVTKAPKVTEASSRIQWGKHTCSAIQALYRALDDYFPLWTTWHGTPVKLRDMIMHERWFCPDRRKAVLENEGRLSVDDNCHKVIELDENNEKKNLLAGHIEYNKKLKILNIKCLDGWISFQKVIVKGRKPMTATDFYNGFISKKTKDLHYFD